MLLGFGKENTGIHSFFTQVKRQTSTICKILQMSLVGTVMHPATPGGFIAIEK